MTFRGTSCGLHSCVSSVLTAAVLTLAAPSASAQNTTGVGAISVVVVNAAGRPAEDSQRFGEQQGIFPIVGFDWRFS